MGLRWDPGLHPGLCSLAPLGLGLAGFVGTLFSRFVVVSSSEIKGLNLWDLLLSLGLVVDWWVFVVIKNEEVAGSLRNLRWDPGLHPGLCSLAPLGLGSVRAGVGWIC